MEDIIHYSLNPLDHLLPRNYVKSVGYIPLKQGASYEDAFAELQEGLHRTFLQLPWLSGKVHWQSQDTPGWRPGQLEIRYDKPEVDGARPYQIKYKELESDLTYEEIQESGYPIDLFEDDEILWAEFLPSLENGAEVFVAQANFIPGACLLSSAIFHSVTDGMGSAMISKTWATNCRSVPTIDTQTAAATDTLPPECSDRTFLSHLIAKEGNERPVSSIDPEIWRLLDLEPPSSSDSKKGIDNIPADGKGGPRPAPSKVMKSHIFYMSAAHYAELKQECAAGSHGDLLSGTDVLYAFLWRALMRARVAAQVDPLDSDAVSHLELANDIRPDFSPNVPPAYVGNCLLHNVVSSPVSSLTKAPLSSVARQIRSDAARFNPQGIHDAYSLLKNEADFRTLRLRFTQTEGYDMMISSLFMFPVDEIALGDTVWKNNGKPDALRQLMGGFNRFFRMCFILPRLASQGVEFVVSLYEEEIQKLMGDEEFAKYAVFSS